jgi:hypothetical protein
MAAVPGVERLTIRTRCTRCGVVEETQTAARATVDPRLDPVEDAGWDGVYLGAVMVCERCGAVDEYVLLPESVARLVDEANRARLEMRPSPVTLGRRRLPDGATIRRPTSAVVRLRELSRERPYDARIWSRLGVMCHGVALEAEAEAAWRTAMELSEDDFVSTFCLAARLAPSGHPESLSLLARAVERFPRADLEGYEDREDLAENIADVLLELPNQIRANVTLQAGWASEAGGGERRASVDLRSIANKEGFARFLARTDLTLLRVSRDVLRPGATALSRLIETGEDPPSADPVWEPERPPMSRSSTRARDASRSRNDPCHCGSGKKFKKCHGR